MIQKIGDCTACDGGTSSLLCATLILVAGGSSAAVGALMKLETMTTITP
jgi:hypothetical protein